MLSSALAARNGTHILRLHDAVASPPGQRAVAIPGDGPPRVLVPADATWDDFSAPAGVELGAQRQPA